MVWLKFACENNGHILADYGCDCTCDMSPNYGTLSELKKV